MYGKDEFKKFKNLKILELRKLKKPLTAPIPVEKHMSDYEEDFEKIDSPKENIDSPKENIEKNNLIVDSETKPKLSGEDL